MRDHLRENTDRHFRMFDAMMKQQKAKDIPGDAEPVDESTLNLEDFKAHQCRLHEIKNHLEPNSMDFEDVLHDKDLLTRKDIIMLNNGASRHKIQQTRAKEWKEYKLSLAAKTR